MPETNPVHSQTGAGNSADDNQHTLIAIVAILDLLIIRQWVIGTTGTLAAIAYHDLIVAVYYVISRRTARPFGLDPRGMVFLLVLLGPFGGVALSVAHAATALHEWVATWRHGGAAKAPVAKPAPTQADLIYAQIKQGRRRQISTAAIRSYDQIFQDGALPDQQAAIAAISRWYQPQMYPALQTALFSNVPVVRVQAAAVFAKLRGDFEAEAKTLLKDPGARWRRAEVTRVARSGFLEADMAERLLALLPPEAETGPVSFPAEPVFEPEAEAEGAKPLPHHAQHPRLHRYSCGGIA